MALFGLAGLYMASRAQAGTFYWIGLFIFVFAVLTIFHTIRSAFDELEGKEPPGLVPAAMVLVAAGSVLFHVVSPWWWAPIASNWNYIDDTINLTFWITGVVFVAIILFMAWCLHRYGHRRGRRAAYEPENKHLEWWLTVGTAVGVAAMLAPGLFVWNSFVEVPNEAHEVEVVGQQWSWAYRLPGEDGELGASGPAYIGPDNPLGLDPDDPAGHDDLIVQGGEVHLPVDRPVKLLLRSIDVLHSFYVPEFRAKMDLVPGLVSSVWFTPTRTGQFELLCAELCGVGHALMRGQVVVDEAEAYQAWLAEQRTFADLSDRALAQATTEEGESD